MHIGLASGLLIVSVGTAASVDGLGLYLAILLVLTLAFASASLATGLVHLLLLEKYLGHLAQEMAYSGAMGSARGGHDALFEAWNKERDKKPKEATLRACRRWKLILGLAGLGCYTGFGVWLVFV